MIDKHSFQQIATMLPTFTDENIFSNQVVNVLGEGLGFHWVNLFLVDEQRQNAIFTAGYGKFTESLLAHKHRLSLSENGIVADVINYGEIHFEKPVHPMPYCWGHEHYKYKPSASTQIDMVLDFKKVREADITDWRTQSAIVPPMGWEICLPMQRNRETFGAIDFLIQLNLNIDEKRFWKEYLLTEKENEKDFSEIQFSGLQWLVNIISSSFQKTKAL
jgi:hypothetical protein